MPPSLLDDIMSLDEDLSNSCSYVEPLIEHPSTSYSEQYYYSDNNLPAYNPPVQMPSVPLSTPSLPAYNPPVQMPWVPLSTPSFPAYNPLVQMPSVPLSTPSSPAYNPPVQMPPVPLSTPSFQTSSCRYAQSSPSFVQPGYITPPFSVEMGNNSQMVYANDAYIPPPDTYIQPPDAYIPPPVYDQVAATEVQSLNNPCQVKYPSLSQQQLSSYPSIPGPSTQLSPVSSDSDDIITTLAENQELGIARAMLKEENFKELFRYINANPQPERHHEAFQDIWLEAVYQRASKKRKGKILNAVDRYRLRKRCPFPPTIWNGDRSFHLLKESAREILHQYYLVNPYPTTAEKRELACTAKISFQQVSNFFKNRRGRLRKEGHYVPPRASLFDNNSRSHVFRLLNS